MREALTLALQEYEGAMVLVSHDRHLLRTATDTLALVAGGRLRTFDGDLDDYRAWLGERRTVERSDVAAGPSRRETKRAEAAARQTRAKQRKPLEQRIQQVEALIERLTSAKLQLEMKLASPVFYAGGDQDQVATALREQARLSAALDEAESDWLRLQAELESIG